MAKANVIGPNLPTNIVNIKRSFENVLRSGVIPKVNPTVPKAEITSNTISSGLKFSVISISIITILT